MPFFYLSRQGFWEPFTAEGTRAASPESCSVCEIHPEFFELLTEPAFRQKARLLLLARYFPPDERAGLLESMGFAAEEHAAAEHEMREVDAEATEAAKRKGRDARFAVGVVARYKFTCALTGLSCVTTNGAVVVEAAHIDPWSKSLNDDLTNGLALCRNAHWAFDEGLWSVAPGGSILVAQQRFAESGPNDLRLLSYRGKPLQFASGVSLRPSEQCLSNHRKAHGLALN